jgi:hypothetical protein
MDARTGEVEGGLIEVTTTGLGWIVTLRDSSL